MAIKTFLDLVNESISECKVTLDPLTSLTFASPPRTLLYNNFKRWCNKGYRELMLERPEWFFRTERTKISLKPRLHLTGLTYIPVVGDVLKGAVSGVQFTVAGVHLFEDNEEDTQVERTVDVTFAVDSDPRDFNNLEVLDRVSPAPATAVGIVRHAGRYNFADDVVGFSELDMDSVRTFYTDSTVGESIEVVPWDSWINRYSYYPFGPSAFPEYITRAPDGNYEFFPQSLEPFIVEFDYSRSYNDMVLSTDVPVGVPEKYQDILVWRAVSEFADYDNNSKLFSRANKNIEKYTYFLNRDRLPLPYIEGSRFTIHHGW